MVMLPREQQSQWYSALMAARRATAEDGGFEQFMKLARGATGGGLYEAKALIGTIMSQPEDNGEGEAVLSILGEFDPELQAKAIVDEMPRFWAEGEDEWAESLVELLARFHSDQFIQAARESSPAVRRYLRDELNKISQETGLRGEIDFAEPLRNLIPD